MPFNENNNRQKYASSIFKRTNKLFLRKIKKLIAYNQMMDE